MLSTKKSLSVQPASGSALQPLGQVVVQQETLTGAACSQSTLVALVAICDGLAANALNPDAMFLALLSASRKAQEHGCSLEEYQRVQDALVARWQGHMARNPMSSMF